MSRSDTSAPDLDPFDALAQLSFVVQGLLDERAGAHDLSRIQVRLLGVLRDRAPTMNALARLLELDKSSVTGLIDRAAQRGLVERVPSPHDARATLVQITAQGRELVRKVGGQYQKDVATLLAPLSSAEQKALASALTKLLTAHAKARGIDLFETIGG